MSATWKTGGLGIACSAVTRALERVVLALAVVALAACAAAQAAPPAPTATEAPLPTDTPLPTATQPAPTTQPSPTPTEEPAYRVVEVAYADEDPERDISKIARWLKLYLPADTTTPYPTVVLLPGGPFPLSRYESLTLELLDRGYAVATVNMSVCPEDSKCAVAWLSSHAEAHSLDSKRIFVFGHLSGGFNAVSLPLNDLAMWESLTTACPHPVPDLSMLRGIIAYDGLFGFAPALRQFSGQMDKVLGVSGSQIHQALEALERVPPKEWPNSDELDDSSREVASRVPPYWAHIAGESSNLSPNFLFIYDTDTSLGGFDFHAAAESMATLLRDAGFDAEVMLLDDSAYTSLVNASTDTPSRIAEAIDAFIGKQTE